VSALYGIVVAILVLAGFLAATSYLRARLSVALTIKIADATTQVFSDDGSCIVEVPTTVRYATDSGAARVVAFGADTVVKGSSDGVELSLATPPGNVPRELHDAWGAYITYCCEKARRELGVAAWRPLRVEVFADTSEPGANDLFRRQASQKALRWIGHVRAAQGQPPRSL